MASWGNDGRRLTVVLNDNTPWYRGAWRWVVVCVVVGAAMFVGGRHVFAATTGSHRCAVVDPLANKVVLVREGDGDTRDTIIRVVGYVDNGDNISYDAFVPRWARRLVTHDTGRTLRTGCR